MRRRKFITLKGSADRLTGATTMRGTLRKSVIAATAVLAIATIPDPANAGAAAVVPYYSGSGYYYSHGYWHPPGGYYYPRAYRRQYNRPFYRGYW